MNTILHFADYNILEKIPTSVRSMAHLITYDIPCMDGEYANRVKVYQNRRGMQGISISQEQLSILQDCVMNDKPQPEFMKSNAQKTQDFIRNMWYSRLKKLEDDLFPNGYIEMLGINPFSEFTVPERLTRIENKLDYNTNHKGYDLDRLEMCERNLKHVYWRLDKLTKEIYQTQKDVDGMKSSCTVYGWIRQLEEKIGVNMPDETIYERISNLEKAWKVMEYFDYEKSKEPSYVCPILKHQQALQDALQDKFGKKETYVPKFKVGDVVVSGEFNFKIDSVGENCGYKVYHSGNCLANCTYIDRNFTLKSQTYVPKYHIGDVLEFNYEWGRTTSKIKGIVVKYKNQSNVCFYRFENGYLDLHCEQVDSDKSVYKVDSQPKGNI